MIADSYNSGYTQALLHFQKLLNELVVQDCKRHKKTFNIKTIQQYIQCFIDHRDILRDNPFAFIRCTGFGKDCKFEVYDSDSKTVI